MDRWQVTIDDCHASGALADFYDDHPDFDRRRALVGLALLPDGMTAKDPLAYDPDRAARELAELHARHPNAAAGGTPPA